MFGINKSRYDEFKSRLPEWAPETEIDTPRGVMDVDRQRRAEGAQPTTLGRAIETEFLRPKWSPPEEADAAARPAPPSPSLFRSALEGLRTYPDRLGKPGLLGTLVPQVQWAKAAITPILGEQEGPAGAVLAEASRPINYVPFGSGVSLARGAAMGVGSSLLGRAAESEVKKATGSELAGTIAGLAGNLAGGGAVGALTGKTRLAISEVGGGDPEELLSQGRKLIRGLSGFNRRELRAAENELTRAMEGGSQALSARSREIIGKALGEDFANKFQPLVRNADGSITRGGVPTGEKVPDVATRVADAIARNEGSRYAPDGDVDSVLRGVNSFYGSLQAAGELSYMLIQGLPSALTNPTKWARAAGLSLRAFADPTIYDSHLGAFTEKALAKGNPGADFWAEKGLLKGLTTEFTVGNKLPSSLGERIGNAPVIRNFNQAFSAFGDGLRLELADAEVDWLKLKGLDLTDSRASSISKTMQRFTGTTDKKTFGNWGDVAMFAPRYFQSRIEALAQFAAKDPYERQLARKTMGRFLGSATALTVAANEALGNDYDYTSPFINGRANPNFMRVRALGRDWSFFGGFDSLVKMGMYAGTGEFDRVARSLLTAPVIAKAWDLLEGRTVTGEHTRGEGGGIARNLATPEFAKYALKAHLPFSWGDDIPQGAMQALRGEYPEAIGSEIAGVFGGRGSPLTATEKLNQVTPGGDYYAAPPSVRDQVRREHPELWSEKVEKGSDTQQQAERMRSDYAKQQSADDAQLQSGAMQLSTWKERRRSRNDQASGAMSAIYLDNPQKEPDPKKPWEVYAKKWADAKLAGGGQATEEDVDAIEAWRASLSAEDNAAIDRETGIGTTPVDRQYRADMKKVAASGYFELRDRIASELTGRETTWAKDVKQIREEALAEAEANLDAQNPNWRQIDDSYARQLADARTRQIVASITAKHFTPILQAWRADPENAETAALLRKWGIAGTGMEETARGIAQKLATPTKP